MLDTLDPANVAVPLQRAQGSGRVIAKLRDQRTVLDTLYQQGCAKIRVPKSQGEWLDAVLINTSGGLTGDDRLSWEVQAQADTHLVVTTQACERVYRSIGGHAGVTSTLDIGSGGRVDWLPQETILFDAAALDRRLDVEMAPDARFLGLEAVILGRTAMGEDAVSAALTDRWRIRRGGKLVHAEMTRLNADCLVSRTNRALLDNARAFGTLCYIGDDADRLAEQIKPLVAHSVDAGVSAIGEKLVVRAMAGSGFALRKIMMPLIARLAAGRAAPRLWTL